MVQPGRVLVVDDDWFARQIYAECLAQEGHDVVTAQDGQEALDRLSREPFDLVVTDVVMPGLDGLELLERAKREAPELDFIVMTSLGSVDSAIRAMRAGALHYLVKPVDPEALQLEVRRSLESRRLLRENQELRRYHALFQTAQRINACLERDRLYPTALDALQAAVGADAALFCLPEPESGAPRVVGRRGLDPGQADWLAAALAEHHGGALASADRAVELEGLRRVIPSRDAPLRHLDRALVLPLRPEQDLVAVLILLRRTETGPFPEAAHRDATFIGEHVAMALLNATRFVAAQNMAHLDSLTGLFNARYLELVLEREIARRKPVGEPFSVLFMDLDHFKKVNDRHGHQVGSKLLVEVGRLLRRCVRAEDVLVRYGGDEFVAVVLDAGTEDAMQAAERTRRMVEEHRFLAREGLNLHLTLCVGVATWPTHAQLKDDIIHRADLAMYHGKRTVRNSVYLFADLPVEPKST